MNFEKYNFTIVHSGNRDSYMLAEALLEANKLDFLVTDDYVFRYLLKKQSNIPLSKIKTSITALFWLFCFKIFKKNIFQIKKDVALSKKAAQVANQKNIHLIAYSYYGFPAFNSLNKNLKKILFQLHPHPTYIKQLFLEEIELLPQAKFSLEQEHELNEAFHLEILKKEAHAADAVFCASSFTKFTLKCDSVTSPIYVVPYGVDFSKFIYKERNLEENVLKVIFVGSINQRKGIYYLLEAIQQLQNKNLNIHLTIFGRGILDVNLVESFKLKNCNIKINASFDALLQGYQDADVFVLPSICEGFGQVILEAMATGLPVIATTNTSLPDLIENNKEGFVIPIRDSNSLAEKLIYLYQNKETCLKMGNFAYEKSKFFTWNSFKNKLIQNLNAE